MLPLDVARAVEFEADPGGVYANDKDEAALSSCAKPLTRNARVGATSHQGATSPRYPTSGCHHERQLHVPRSLPDAA